MSGGQDFFMSPMPKKYFGLAPYPFPVFWNANNKTLQSRKGIGLGLAGWPLSVLQGSDQFRNT